MSCCVDVDPSAGAVRRVRPSGGFVDSAERYVVLPDRVGRVMTANQSADVLVFVLAPEKLLGWSAPLSRGQRAFIPAKFARLPIVGGAIRPNPAEAVQVIARMRPDLIIEVGPGHAEAPARAEQVQQQTGVPYLVLDNSIQATPHNLRTIGDAARCRRARRRSRPLRRLRDRCRYAADC